MERSVGTVVRGIRTPIIQEGDNLVDIVVNSVLKATESAKFSLRDRDIIGITEAVVSRAAGNYATIDDIANDIKEISKWRNRVVFPILSRNRFSLCLRGIARGAKDYYAP